MTKLKAAGIHFFISITVVATILFLMFAFWYPNAYFKLMGGKKLIYLIAGVDIFIGPLLTMVVYKSGKKSLKFDLLCVAILQIIAMSYGLYVMFVARPIFTVFNQNSFYVVSVIDIVPSELAKAKKEEWRVASLTGPRLVAIGLPSDYNIKEDSLLVYSLGDTIQTFPRAYLDYSESRNLVIKAAKNLDLLSGKNTENKFKIDIFLKKLQRPSTDFLYLPVNSAVNQMSAIIDAKTGRLVEILDIK